MTKPRMVMVLLFAALHATPHSGLSMTKPRMVMRGSSLDRVSMPPRARWQPSQRKTHSPR